MMSLVRQELEIINQTRSTLCGWRGQFTPDSKPIELDGFKKPAGRNSLILTAKPWIESAHAIRLVSETGRCGGGTFAHKDKLTPDLVFCVACVTQTQEGNP